MSVATGAALAPLALPVLPVEIFIQYFDRTGFQHNFCTIGKSIPRAHPVRV